MESGGDFRKFFLILIAILAQTHTICGQECNATVTGTIFKRVNRAIVSPLELKIDTINLGTRLDFYSYGEYRKFWMVLRFYECQDNRLYFTLRSCYDSCDNNCYHYLSRNGTSDLGLELEPVRGYPETLMNQYDSKLFYYDPTRSPYADYLPLRQITESGDILYVNNNGSVITLDALSNVWAFVPVGSYGGNSITNLLTYSSYSRKRRRRRSPMVNSVVFWYKQQGYLKLGMRSTTAESSTTIPPAKQRLQALLFIIYPLLSVNDTEGEQAYDEHYEAVLFRISGSDDYIDGSAVDLLSGMINMDSLYTPSNVNQTFGSTNITYHEMDFRRHTLITRISDQSTDIMDQKHVDTRFFKIVRLCGTSASCSTRLESIVQPGHNLAVLHPIDSPSLLVLTPFRTDLPEDVLQFGFDFVVPSLSVNLQHPIP